MANTDTPFGMKPIRYLNGSPWNGACRMYCILSTESSNAYAIGDPVVVTGDSDSSGISTVILATAGSGITGIIVGYGGSVYGGPGAVPGSLETTVIPATKGHNWYVMVADDPNIIFEVQEADGGTALTAAAVGLNANLVAGTNNGYVSGWELDNSTEATTATLDVKLLGLSQRKTTTPNAFGDWAKWEVLINNHTYRGGVAGVA